MGKNNRKKNQAEKVAAKAKAAADATAGMSNLNISNQNDQAQDTPTEGPTASTADQITASQETTASSAHPTAAGQDPPASTQGDTVAVPNSGTQDTATTALAPPATTNPHARATPVTASKDAIDAMNKYADPVDEGESLAVTSNFLPITKTPLIFHEYLVKYSMRKEVADKDGVRAPREVRRRDEKVEVLKSLQAGFANVPFAFSVECDKIWSLAPIPGQHRDTGAGLAIRFSDVPYTRRDNIAETLDWINLTLHETWTFNIPLTSAHIYSLTPPRQQLLDMTMAFASNFARLQTSIAMVGPSRFFTMDSEKFRLNEAVFAKTGYSMSMRALKAGVGAVVKPTATCFLYGGPERTVLSLIRQILKSGGTKDLLDRMLRGLRVQINFKRGHGTVQTNGKPQNLDARQHQLKTIAKVGLLATKQFIGDSEAETVQGHMAKKYPKVSVEAEDYAINVSLANPAQSVWYPASKLDLLPDQPAHAFISQLFVSEIVQMAAHTADVNREMVRGKGVPMLGLQPNDQIQGSLVQKYPGFAVADRLLDVPARRLPAPQIAYGPTTRQVEEASWDVKNTPQFLRNGSLKDWKYINFFGDKDRVLTWLRTVFVLKLREHGFKDPKIPSKPVAEPQLLRHINAPDEKETHLQLEQAVIRARDEGVSLLLVVLPDNGKSLYRHVKRIADIEYGVPTICVDGSKKTFSSPQYASNVALKLNLRLQNGLNHRYMANALQVTLLKGKNVIIMGADCVHLGGAGQKRGCPTIACVTANTEDEYAQWLTSMRLQHSLTEQIQDMAEMVRERLNKWASVNRTKTFSEKKKIPSAIIFYRDGVGESQQKDFCEPEMKAIRAGWESSAFKKEPFKLTYILVTKRHAMRFYPSTTRGSVTDHKHVSKHGNNLKPGLFVEHAVVHPNHYNFYLQAHAAIKGTARPAHYEVLRNDSGFSPTRMATLTHAMSYGVGSATKGVSYAAPTFLADKALTKASNWLKYGQYETGEETPVQFDNEDDVTFYQRCLDYAKHHNPKWDRSRDKEDFKRPGPWGPALDNIMWYT